MKTGARFWQLVGLVIFILGAYGLAELYDAVNVREKQISTQKHILSRQKTLLQNNHWAADLAAVDLLRQAWLTYLPPEDSVAVAKAHLLNDMRSLAENAGMTNLSVTATEVEDKSSAGSAPGTHPRSANNYGSSDKKTEADALPEGVRLIKVKLAGRFNPAAFTALLRALEESGRFAVIERASVRGVQMELNLRCYWRTNTSKTAAKPENPDASLIATTH